jgi:hypothetical protein
MATKVRIMKMLQEIRGLAQITSRRPPSKMPGLLLIQMRPNGPRTITQRKKTIIKVDVQEPLDIPNPVKITHLKTHPASSTPSV